MGSDPDSWMWERARTVLSAARFEHRVLRPGRHGRGRAAAWVPPIDVFGTPTELWILVALPGVSPRQVEVALGGGKLVVAGQRGLPRGLGRAEVHRLEIPSGRFERALELPPGAWELRSREMRDGCLALKLGKVD